MDGKIETAMKELGSKTVSWEEQRNFARVTGDYNPVHMDDIAARRTQAGKALVHGMHMVMWALDRLIAEEVLSMPLAGFKARFSKMVYVGETIALWVIRESGSLVSAQVRVGNTVAVMVSVMRGELAPALPPTVLESDKEGERARDLTLEEMNGKSGSVLFANGAEDMFLSAGRALGSTRVRAIGAITRLVGMVCPGLHSMAYSYDVAFTKGGEDEESLSFRVEEVDERFRLLTQVVNGGGLKGTVVAIARVPPVSQPRLNEIAKWVNPREFAGINALVIGGSRGLGELTAKMIAAGGGSVVITYAVGSQEAHTVCEEIRAWGGRCETMQYDVRRGAAEQLDGLARMPSHLFYFATNVIFTRADGVFSAAAFEGFRQFYLTGFYDLCEALMKKRGETVLHVFYPSSVFVTERPAGMTEYAMAKAAGEVLCKDMTSAMPGLQIKMARLPRLLTDQTATATALQTEDPIQVLLPLVREMSERELYTPPLS